MVYAPIRSRVGMRAVRATNPPAQPPSRVAIGPPFSIAVTLRGPDPVTAAIVQLHPIGVIQTVVANAINGVCEWSLPAFSSDSASS